VPDHFRTLGLPHRPWLDPEAVKTRFLELSRTVHPDRHHQADVATRHEHTAAFASLNAAHECLVNPRTRVQHLLELFSGARTGDVRNVPPDIADRFPSVIALCKEAERRLRDHAALNSPLLRARSARTSLDLRTRIESMQHELASLRQSHVEQLRILDSRWPVASADTAVALPTAPPTDLEHLAVIAASLAFLDRWITQLASLSFELAGHVCLA
jgi:DnaJ-domain-containing protein 1